MPRAEIAQSREETGRGGTTPMLPATGSTITAATASRCRARTVRTASRSLNGTVTVRAASAAGTPRLSGMEKVAPPEPALTSRLSAWP